MRILSTSRWLALSAVLAACGARTELPVGSAGAGGIAGSAASSTASSTGSGATGVGGCDPGCPSPCDGLSEPECFDCDGNLVGPQCDGTGWVCPAFSCACVPAIWQQTSAGVGAQRGAAIAVAPDGAVVVAGEFSGTIDLGGATFTSSEANLFELDVVVAKLLPDGTHVWSRAFGAVGDNFVKDLIVDAAGNTIIVGTYQSAQAIDGFMLPDGTPQAVFVIKLDPSGNALFAKGFVSGSNGTRARAEAMPNGDIVLAGDTSGTIDFGGGPIAGDNTIDAFVVRLDPNGNLVYARRFSGTSHESATDVAIAPDGDAIVIGTFKDTVDFGLGPLVSSGSFDVFVIRLDGSGSVVQSAAYGGPGDDRGHSVVVDSGGNVILEASYANGADFGSGSLSTGALGGVIASYDPVGTLNWLHAFAGPSATIFGGDVFRLAVDGKDNVVLAGQFEGSFVLDSTSLGAKGDYDVVVARLSPQGLLLGACRYGGVISDSVGGVTVDPASGEVLLTGDYWSTIDFGLGPLTGDANGNMFITRLPAAGVQ